MKPILTIVSAGFFTLFLGIDASAQAPVAPDTTQSRDVEVKTGIGGGSTTQPSEISISEKGLPTEKNKTATAPSGDSGSAPGGITISEKGLPSEKNKAGTDAPAVEPKKKKRKRGDKTE